MTRGKSKNAGTAGDVSEGNGDAQPFGMLQHCAELGELRLGRLRVPIVRRGEMTHEPFEPERRRPTAVEQESRFFGREPKPSHSGIDLQVNGKW